MTDEDRDREARLRASVAAWPDDQPKPTFLLRLLDEARAERDRLQIYYENANAARSEALARAELADQRGFEVSAELEHIRNDLDAALAREKRLREALEYVEWSPGEDGPDGPPVCPACGRMTEVTSADGSKAGGVHEADCILAAALAKEPTK
jgi:hypothetical protein